MGGARTWQRAIPTTFSTSLGFEGRKFGPRGLMKVAPMHSSSWTQLVRPPISGPKTDEFVGCPWNGTILKGKFHPEPSSINFLRGCFFFVFKEVFNNFIFFKLTKRTQKRVRGQIVFSRWKRMLWVCFRNSGYVLPTKNHPKTLHLGAPEAWDDFGMLS